MEQHLSEIGAAKDPFKLVLFPHMPTEVEIPAALRNKSVCVGAIHRSADCAAGLWLDRAARHVIITGGAGGFHDTVDFYNLSLQAVSRCAESTLIEAILFTGPLFRRWKDLRMVPGVRLIPFEPGLPGLLATADLVLCQGGYNTVTEVLAVDRPAICLPGIRDYDDQHVRATEAAGSSPCFEVFRDGGAVELATRIAYRLSRPRSFETRSPAPSSGAVLAANAILDMCLMKKTGRG
jgi:predicted glycosyltransferase